MFIRTQRMDLTGGTMAAVDHIKQAIDIMQGELSVWGACRLEVRKRDETGLNRMWRWVKIEARGKFFPSQERFRFESVMVFTKYNGTSAGAELGWRVYGGATIMFTREDVSGKLGETEQYYAEWEYCEKYYRLVKIARAKFATGLPEKVELTMIEVSRSCGGPPQLLGHDWTIGRDLRDRQTEPFNRMR